MAEITVEYAKLFDTVDSKTNTVTPGRLIPVICRNGFPFQLVADWLSEYEDRSPNVARTYAYHLLPMFRWLDRAGVELEAISDDDPKVLRWGHMRMYRSHLLSLDISQETARQYMDTALRFVRWVCGPTDWAPVFGQPQNRRYRMARGFLTGILRDKSVSLKRVQVRKPVKRFKRALTADELDTIRKWIMAKWKYDPQMQCLYRCLLELLYDGALRRGELLSLRANSLRRNNILQVQIDLDEWNRAWLSGRELAYSAKTGGRPILLHPATVAWVNKWLNEYRPAAKALAMGHNYLLCNLTPVREGNPFSPDALRHFISLINRPRATGGPGINRPGDQPVAPHTFRHSWATIMREDGAALDVIQQHLGHSSIATTQIYAKIGDKKKRAEIRDLYERSRGYQYLIQEADKA